MTTIYGRQVQIAQPSPRLQCSAAFTRLQSPELVAETNAWMRGFFGFNPPLIPDGQVYALGDTGPLVMTEKTCRDIIAAIESQK